MLHYQVGHFKETMLLSTAHASVYFTNQNETSLPSNRPPLQIMNEQLVRHIRGM